MADDLDFDSINAPVDISYETTEACDENWCAPRQLRPAHTKKERYLTSLVKLIV